MMKTETVGFRRAGITTQRGFTMIAALLITVILLLAALAMITNANYTAADTRQTEQKNSAFDAAYAGLNAVMDSMDGTTTNLSQSSTLSNGYSYTTTGVSHLTDSSSTTWTTTDPATGQTITLPGGTAFVSSTGKSPNSGRTVVVEGVVKTGQTTVTFPNDTIDAAIDIDRTWNSGNNCIGVTASSSGANDGNIHANGNIPANICFTQGNASASGTITGNPNATSTTPSAPQITFPVMGPFISQEKALAQAGGNNLYINPGSGGTMPTSFTCPSSVGGDGCVVFYDGNYTMAGGVSLTFSGEVTLVINGNYKSDGNSSLVMQSGTHSMLVVNGNAEMGGNNSTGALVWAKGDATLHGNESILGSVIANGNVHLAGGGSNGGVQRDLTLKNTTRLFPGKVVLIGYAEY